MIKLLKYLIILGLILWGFLLFEKYQPDNAVTGFFSDANKGERCAKYTVSVEGNEILGYGGRMRQFIDGCW